MDPSFATFAVRNYSDAHLYPPDGILYPEELYMSRCNLLQSVLGLT